MTNIVYRCEIHFILAISRKTLTLTQYRVNLYRSLDSSRRPIIAARGILIVDGMNTEQEYVMVAIQVELLKKVTVAVSNFPLG